MSPFVKPEDGEAVLLGKAVNELQSGMTAVDGEVVGTLKYVSGYVDFSSNIPEWSGDHLTLKIETEPAEAEIVVELVGGTRGSVALDDDMNIVLLIKNKNTQSIKAIATHNGESITKTYGFSGLALETE